MAIIDARGWEAVFRHEDDAHPKFSRSRLACWQELESGDVVGLIVHNGELVSAQGLSNFYRYDEVRRIVGVLPVSDVVLDVSRDDVSSEEPCLGLIVSADGSVWPITDTAAGIGVVEEYYETHVPVPQDEPPD